MLQELLAQLQDQNRQRRATARSALIKLGESATQPLTDELSRCEESGIGEVAYALARIGNSSSIKHIAEAIAKLISKHVCEDLAPGPTLVRCIDALSLYGAPAIECIAGCLSHNYEINKVLCKSLRSICDSNDMDLDRTLRTNRKEPLPAQALRALIEIGSLDALYEMKGMLNCPEEMARAEAASALANLCSKNLPTDRLRLFRENGVDSALIHALTDTPLVQKYAAAAVGALENRRAVPGLLEILRTSTPVTGHLQRAWEHAALSLARLQATEATAVIADLLERRSEHYYHCCAPSFVKALGIMGDRNAVRALKKIVKDRRSPDQLRCLACVSLGKLKDQRALPVLYKMLQEEEPDLRCCAIDAIAEIGDPHSAPVLRTAFDEEEDSDVIMAMAAALGCVGNEMDAPLLVSTAVSERLPVRVSRAATASLARLGKTAAPYLVQKACFEENSYLKRSYLDLIPAVGAPALDLVLSDLEQDDPHKALLALDLLVEMRCDVPIELLIRTLGRFWGNEEIESKTKRIIELVVKERLKAVCPNVRVDDDWADALLKRLYQVNGIETA